ncbi:protein kinase domain-containing protein [Actinophytocola sp.]|uniref:serine/threonine-protein kinase n=1 Tax=Actinophytocola sp. TaxID=1872138 RepID=UPI00389A4C0C
MIVDGRYRVGPRLGRGGMADVFEAWDSRLERKVAIKRYRAIPHGVGLRRFMSEAELLGGLSHPGLLTVYDMSFDGEHPFLVLSLATGGTLRDRLDTGTLPQSRVAEIGATVAEVLAYVHEQGIVHRDVKPSNILFDDQGDCYLGDFGIARAIGAAHITDSREFVGTAAYLAPEQVEGRSPGPQVDVYALGLVLLECMTGVPEYTGTDVEMALARLTRPPRVPGTWGAQWRAVLTAMTATNPEERPTTQECVSLLRALEAGETVPMAVPTRRSPKVYAGMATVAAAALAAIALGGGPVPVTGAPNADPTQVVQHTPAPVQRPAEAANTAPPAAQQPTEPPPTGQAAGAEHGDDSGKGSSSGKSGRPNGRSGKPGHGNAGEGNAGEAEAG